jgi:DNA-binding NarL/FixJ family response regulator
MNQAKVNLLLVDDHQMFIEGIKAYCATNHSLKL